MIETPDIRENENPSSPWREPTLEEAAGIIAGMTIDTANICNAYDTFPENFSNPYWTRQIEYALKEGLVRVIQRGDSTVYFVDTQWSVFPQHPNQEINNGLRDAGYDGRFPNPLYEGLFRSSKTDDVLVEYLGPEIAQHAKSRGAQLLKKMYKEETEEGGAVEQRTRLTDAITNIVADANNNNQERNAVISDADIANRMLYEIWKWSPELLAMASIAGLTQLLPQPIKDISPFALIPYCYWLLQRIREVNSMDLFSQRKNIRSKIDVEDFRRYNVARGIDSLIENGSKNIVVTYGGTHNNAIIEKLLSDGFYGQLSKAKGKAYSLTGLGQPVRRHSPTNLQQGILDPEFVDIKY